MQGMRESCIAITTNPDNTRALTGYSEGTMIVWILDISVRISNKSNAQRSIISTVAISNSSRCSVTGNSDGSVWIWALDAEAMVKIFSGEFTQVALQSVKITSTM